MTKTDQSLRAFGPDGKLVAFDPVTAGSSEKLALNGTLKVTMVKKNPTYRYDPKYKFKGVPVDFVGDERDRRIARAQALGHKPRRSR